MLNAASVALQYVGNVRADNCGGSTSNKLDVNINVVPLSSDEEHCFYNHRRSCLIIRNEKLKLIPQFVCQTYCRIGSWSTEAVPPWPTNYCLPWQEPHSKLKPWFLDVPSPLNHSFIETWIGSAPIVFHRQRYRQVGRYQRRIWFMGGESVV